MGDIGKVIQGYVIENKPDKGTSDGVSHARVTQRRVRQSG